MEEDGTEFQLEPEVEAVIQELFPCDDPLDDPDFDPIQYINTLFPNEQALSSLDETMLRLRKKVRVLDHEIQSSIRGQIAGGDGQQSLGEAQEGMHELMERIKDIKVKAETSERMVQEITQDIKSLDNAKQNLTASILTLNHLHMMYDGVERLTELTEQRCYRDAANLLAAVLNVQQHFADYTHIPQVRELMLRVDGISKQLASQVTHELKLAFRTPEPDTTDLSATQISEACLVFSALSQEKRTAIRTFLIGVHLKSYTKSFADEDNAWLDKVDRRYAWFRRMMTGYKNHGAVIFPQNWSMAFRLAQQFCEMTVEQLNTQLQRRRTELDVKLLLHGIQKTAQFEQWLNATFKPSKDDNDLQQELAAQAAAQVQAGKLHKLDSAEAEAGAADAGEHDADDFAQSEADVVRAKYAQPKTKQSNPTYFTNAVGKVFEKYMSVYLDAQDAQLTSMITKDFKAGLVFLDQDTADEEDDTVGAKVLASAGDMFVFFRNCMLQCASITTGEKMHALYLIFKKHIQQYADIILKATLPKGSGLPSLLLKEGELKLTAEEMYAVCSILNTADYCHDTIGQLAEKLQDRLDAPYNAQVDLTPEQDMFYEITSTCTQALVRALETLCEPPLNVMIKTKWEATEEVGDTSLFVSTIGKSITSVVPRVRRYCGGNRKFFTSFCLKFVSSYVPKVLTAIKKCRGVTPVAAEQLLLDMQSLKKALLDMPSTKALVPRKAPATYTKTVTRGLQKIEVILKMLQNPHDPRTSQATPEMFVRDFLEMFGGEEGVAGFQNVLEMKGLKKSEIQPLTAAFTKATGSGVDGEAASAESAQQGAGDGSGAKPSLTSRNFIKLESLLKRFK
eukprot:m.124645 g.124645  ORF g.124645 m.124645 type:complete len:849 (-) comp13779_c0_seq3:48-2594(-)